jgi:GTP-binding protein
MPKPIVAIVGRPNVGKSTLFNRVVGQRLAITHEVPGTTRDRLYAEAEWGGVSFILVDTAGLEVQSSKLKAQKTLELGLSSRRRIETNDLMAQVRTQAQIAIAEADVILFLVDVKDGLTASDEEVAQVLRRTAKPVLLAVNKAESQARLRCFAAQPSRCCWPSIRPKARPAERQRWSSTPWAWASYTPSRLCTARALATCWIR